MGRRALGALGYRAALNSAATLRPRCLILLLFSTLLALPDARAAPVHLAVCDQNTAIYLGQISTKDDASRPLEPFSPAIPPRPDTLDVLSGVAWQVLKIDRGDESRALSAPTWAWVNRYLADDTPEPCTSEDLCEEYRVDLGACQDPHGTLYASLRLGQYDQPLAADSPGRAAFDWQAERSDMVVVHTQQLNRVQAAMAVAVEPRVDGSPQASLMLQRNWRAQIPVSHWTGPDTYAAPVNIRNEVLVVEIFGGERSGWMIVTPTATGFTHASMWSRVSHD